jgi:hypothetical protein
MIMFLTYTQEIYRNIWEKACGLGLIMNSVEIKWDNEQKTILRYIFTGDWTWDEYLERLNEGRTMMAEVEHSVCVFAF